jgi:hypothetical protein
MVAQLPAAIPSTAQCAAWSRQLGDGGAGAIQVLRLAWFAGCPSTGPSDLANAIANSATVTDTAYLWPLIQQAGLLAHPSVFNAAIANARNPTSSVPSVSASLLILAEQLGYSAHVHPYPLFSELSVDAPAKATRLCGPELGGYAPPAPADQALPADHERQAAALFDALQTGSASARVRNLARCLRIVVSEIPPQIDVSGVTLTYQNCTRFVIHNPTDFTLPMGVDVVQTGEHFGWPATPGENKISTLSVGTVTLTYDGVVIRTAANEGKPC